MQDAASSLVSAYTRIGSRNKLPLVQLRDSWEVGSAYKRIGSRNKLPRNRFQREKKIKDSLTTS